MSDVLKKQLTRFQLLAVGAGVAGLGLLGALAYFQGLDGMFESYLLGFLFWVGLSLGCLVMLYVQHLAGGSWGALIRRPLEAGGMTILLMALLFVPVALGLGSLYSWTNADYLAAHPIVASKTLYLNVPFFLGRSAFYFVVWALGAWYFFKRSKDQDDNAEEAAKIGFNLKKMGGFWIAIHIMTVTFAMIDWSMSLTPEFFSGIYPVIYMIGQAITAVCFVIFITVWLAGRSAQIDELLTSKRLQDLGNFLMAFTMFWAYTSFAQLIILWSNNIVETNPYYLLRFGPLWKGVGLFLMFFGFFAPFLILFSRWVKRKRSALVLVAVWAIIVRFTDVFFFIVPNYERSGFQLTLMDAGALLGIGGLWLAAFAYLYSSRPVLPVNDPRLAQHEEHAHEATQVQYSGAGD